MRKIIIIKKRAANRRPVKDTRTTSLTHDGRRRGEKRAVKKTCRRTIGLWLVRHCWIQRKILRVSNAALFFYNTLKRSAVSFPKTGSAAYFTVSWRERTILCLVFFSLSTFFSPFLLLLLRLLLSFGREKVKRTL